MSARFTNAEAEEIDAARGSMDRSPWLREAALAAAGQQPAGVPPTMPPAPATPRPRRPAPVRFREPPAEPEAAAKNCKHPKVRVKGSCPDCGTWVASKR